MTELYRMDDWVVPIPTGFTDRSINVLEWRLEDSTDKLALVVQREYVPTGTKLDKYVKKETKNYPSKFLGYRLERDDAHEGAVPGSQVCHNAFRYKKDNDVIYTHQAFVLLGVQIVLLTGTAKATFKSTVDEVVDEAVNGLKLRED